MPLKHPPPVAFAQDPIGPDPGPHRFRFPMVNSTIALHDGAMALVDARTLHHVLGLGREFPHWIKETLAKHKLVEGVDYLVQKRASKRQLLFIGRDWLLHPGVALKIAIVQRFGVGFKGAAHDDLMRENNVLRDAVRNRVEHYMVMHPETVKILAAYDVPHLTDEERARRCGWTTAREWCDNIAVLGAEQVLLVHSWNQFRDIELDRLHSLPE